MDRKTQNALTIAKFTAYAGVLSGIVLIAGDSQNQALFIWVLLLASGSFRHFALYDSPRERYAPFTFILEIVLATLLSRLGYSGLDMVLLFVIISESTISCRLTTGIGLTGLSLLGLASARINHWTIQQIAVYAGINGAGLVFAFAASYAVKREIERSAELAEVLEQLGKSKADLEVTYGELVHSQMRLQEMAVMEERARMAREIHDTLAHSLTAIIVTLEGARKRLERGDSAIGTDLERVQEQARLGLDEVRRSIAQMRPEALAQGSFCNALHILVEQIQKWHNIHTELHLPEALPRLEPEQEVALFRLVQEAATNAVRHGKSKNLTVELREQDGALILLVRDDGVGCSDIVPGNGLTGMQERMKVVSGSILVNSVLGQGFEVEATIPLTRSE